LQKSGKGRQNFKDPSIGAFRASPCKAKCGWKQKYDCDKVWEAVLLIPLHRKRTLRKLASALVITVSTLHRMKQDKEDNVIAPHSNAIKPHLTEHHHLARVLYSITSGSFLF
jgi:hypothetical protein